jgi:hypothetical protein
MKHFRTAFLALAAVAVQAFAADGDSPSPTTEKAAIPYTSLDEAMKALRAKPGVEFRSEGGWIVAYDPDEIVSWLLTPPGHPAYPSIVKRYIVNSASGAEMVTDTRCFASKDVCDKLFGGG